MLLENGRATVEHTDESAAFEYNDGEARGRVEFKRGAYGPTISINGREIGYIDLFPCSEEGDGGLPQILFFDEPRSDEPLLKVILAPGAEGRVVAVVNRHARGAAPPEGAYGIYDGDAFLGFPEG